MFEVNVKKHDGRIRGEEEEGRGTARVFLLD